MSLIHKHTHTSAAVKLVKVRAGSKVRMNVSILDGGVALDWTDDLLTYNDIFIWSDARRGVIGRPVYSVDEDDPTVLQVEYTTSSSDLPGSHKLQVDVTYNGWQMIHTVAAYWLTGNLYIAGKGTKIVSSEEVTTTDLTLTLNDVSTTYLQTLIDELVSLKQGESERLTAIEGLLEETDENAEDLDARLTEAESDITSLQDELTSVRSELEAIIIPCAYADLPEEGQTARLYVDVTAAKAYVWSEDLEAYVCVAVGQSVIDAVIQTLSTAQEDIAALQTRCSDAEERLTALESTTAATDKTVSALQTSLDGVSDRVTSLETKTGSLSDSLDNLTNTVNSIGEGLDAFTEITDGEIDEAFGDDTSDGSDTDEDAGSEGEEHKDGTYTDFDEGNLYPDSGVTDPDPEEDN